MRRRGKSLPTANDLIRDASLAKLGVAALAILIGLGAWLLTTWESAPAVVIGGILYAVACAAGWGMQVAIDRWLISSGGIQAGAYVAKIVILTIGAIVVDAVASQYLRGAALTFATCVIVGLIVETYIYVSRPLPPLDIPEMSSDISETPVDVPERNDDGRAAEIDSVKSD